MKKNIIKTAVLVAVGCSALLGVGCDSGIFNGARNRQAVVEKYGTDVWNVRDEKYHFIARKPDGSVWYVETMGGDKSLISAETQLFGANK